MIDLAAALATAERNAQENSTMDSIRLLTAQTGRAAPLGSAGVPSGFVKTAVEGAVRVGLLGLDGDEQADLRVHGGPEKAVYGYSAAHYADWLAEFPEHADRFRPGGMGENLTIEGLDETGIFVGDVHAIGGARLQVCQPRQPCFKLGLRFSDNRLLKAMIRSGRSGWYYRVLQPGIIRAGDTVRLDERPNPDFAFDRLVAIIYRGAATIEELARLAEMLEVASQIRRMAQHRVSSGNQRAAH
jgi:MOSC domain-containing protein YiiM